MKPYRIIVSYDGTDYQGWQEQKESSTVAGVLQDTFKRVFGHPIKVVGASRTDSGVHALGQVARFYTDRSLDCSTMLRSWNGALPKALHIVLLEQSPDGFHPQHNVQEKIYHYYFTLQRPLPFDVRYVYYYPYTLCLNRLRECLQLFVGEHDFFAFCTGNCNKGTVCTINDIVLTFDERSKIYCIVVRGKRFLHHMIRRLVGASLKVASFHKYSSAEIAHALSTRTMNSKFPTAPASGLVLQKIVYQSEFDV